jgi:DNA-directed RNA polymerase specialized sigma subunit
MADAKAYLQQVKLYDTHINNKLEELARLKTLATQVTSSIKPVPAFGSGNSDKLGNIVAKIVDLESEINEAVDVYIDKQREISRMLEKLEDADQVAVLHKRYFEYMPWEQIACDMHMTYRNVCYIHGRALQEMERLVPHD